LLFVLDDGVLLGDRQGADQTIAGIAKDCVGIRLLEMVGESGAICGVLGDLFQSAKVVFGNPNALGRL
jgi:hypothetical protein